MESKRVVIRAEAEGVARLSWSALAAASAFVCSCHAETYKGCGCGHSTPSVLASAPRSCRNHREAGGITRKLPVPGNWFQHQKIGTSSGKLVPAAGDRYQQPQ